MKKNCRSCWLFTKIIPRCCTVNRTYNSIQASPEWPVSRSSKEWGIKRSCQFLRLYSVLIRLIKIWIWSIGWVSQCQFVHHKFHKRWIRKQTVRITEFEGQTLSLLKNWNFEVGNCYVPHHSNNHAVTINSGSSRLNSTWQVAAEINKVIWMLMVTHWQPSVNSIRLCLWVQLSYANDIVEGGFLSSDRI
jgi:hypothetical protein